MSTWVVAIALALAAALSWLILLVGNELGSIELWDDEEL